MKQPFIIEAQHTEGDNQISFSIRGSVEWGKQHSALTESNILHFFTTQLKSGVESEGYKELVEAITALSKKESYQGKNVKVAFSQEAE